MSKRRKINDLASQQFYKFEKWILAEESLKKLSPTAKLLYMVLRDREQLSLKNYKDFTDKEGCIFQYFDQENASELLGVSLTAIKKAFKDLQQYKLIESVRQGLGKPNRLYVLDYKVSEDTLKELSYENKKASSIAVDEAHNIKSVKNDFSNNSIPQNTEKDTKKLKENMETISKSEVVKVIEKSCVNIKREDLKNCIEEFIDINKLKEALTICEINNSHGIKALRMAYKYGDRSNNNSNKGASSGVNDNFKKYGEKELEDMLFKSQERKFKANYPYKEVTQYTKDGQRIDIG